MQDEGEVQGKGKMKAAREFNLVGGQITVRGPKGRSRLKRKFEKTKDASYVRLFL